MNAVNLEIATVKRIAKARDEAVRTRKSTERLRRKYRMESRSWWSKIGRYFKRRRKTFAAAVKPAPVS